MIYEYPSEDVPLRQGDILYPIPFTVFMDPSRFSMITTDGKLMEDTWIGSTDQSEKSIVLPIKPAWGIVATQDCDAQRSPVISFFLIDLFHVVTRLTTPKTPNSWKNMITTRSRLNLSWFYLPNDDNVGFSDRMAINFHVMFQIGQKFLENNRNELRKARLCDVAYQHYRERIAQYFRRYPYDEWYPLTKEEFQKYCESKNMEFEPFEWQK
jgi:hypothetical protein